MYTGSFVGTIFETIDDPRTIGHMRIEFRTHRGCQNAQPIRRVLADCLDALGIEEPIVDRVGHYPSPTVLIDGVDVMRPESGPPEGEACRLDLPTHGRVLDAITAALQCEVASGT